MYTDLQNFEVFLLETFNVFLLWRLPGDVAIMGIASIVL